jgi:glycosyltransferase involved in cell wall biosynthesis
MEPVAIVIPTLNEASAIGAVIREIPKIFSADIIVADSGSTDGTQSIAREAGARVIDAGRGYGRACALGAAAADPSCRVIAFLDGDGADRGDLIADIVGPILDGTQDFVLASIPARCFGIRYLPGVWRDGESALSMACVIATCARSAPSTAARWRGSICEK